MNKKMKLRYRAALSLILSAALFCMPALAFSMNGENAIGVMAEESVESESGTEKESESTGESPTEQETAGKETETESESKDGEGETESGTVSGNDAKPECTCKEKCTRYSVDQGCEACKGDYSLCEYVNPNVKITIATPSGWHNDTTKVHISAEDVAHSGNFAIKTVQAKIAQNGSWTDITEDMYAEISENATVYVLVTDQRGKTYERSRYIRCFDFTKPTLNAAVSDGLLSVQVHDTDSGAKAVYVNGYEFTELTNGTLNIRLQQFDAGYENFTISAMDNAGNMSDIYKTKNPYYKDPAAEGDDDPAKQLPESAEATKPGSATGIVTEHTKTDSGGSTVSQTPGEQKKQELSKADAAENTESGGKEKEDMGLGKEFYTIQTASEKVFYLIIDRDGEEETVYFLTEITERDLLNATSDNSETLPKNSAAVESAIPTNGGALPNNNGGTPEGAQRTGENAGETESTEGTEGTENTENTESTAEPELEKKAEPNPLVSYILMGVLAAGFIGGAYYFKIARKKKEDFIEDEDEDVEDDDVYENEDEEPEDGSGDDFFADDDGETDEE